MTILSSSALSELTPEKVSFKSNAFQNKLLAWYKDHRRSWPWRENPSNPYSVWVSEIMLQQTVIKAVLPVYQSFLKQFPTVSDLARATEEQVRLAVRGLGYYRRFHFLHQAAKLIDAQDSIFPSSYKEWLQLPGVGDYTAAAVSSIVYGESYPVIDGNVERVYARIFDVRLPSNLKEYKKQLYPVAASLLFKKDPGSFNQAIMELGQDICVSLSAPKCHECPVQAYCKAYANKSVHLAPQKKIKQEMVEEKIRLLIVEKKNQIALLKRPMSAKFLKLALGFPTEIFCFRAKNYKPDGDGFSYEHIEAAPLKTSKSINHTITKHKLSVHILKTNVTLKRNVPASDLIWVPKEKVDDLLVASLDRKVWKAYQKER